MKSDIRKIAERLLASTLNHTEVGRLINRHRDTVRHLRRRVAQADLRPEMLDEVPDARLREMPMPSSQRPPDAFSQTGKRFSAIFCQQATPFRTPMTIYTSNSSPPIQFLQR